MKVFYSTDTKGFYNSVVHAEIPKDSVEVSQAEYEELLGGLSLGKLITLGSDGKLQLSDQPVKERDWPSEIALARYSHEVSGITAQGLEILTDRDTQGKLTASALRAQRNNDYSVDWKQADGTFVNLAASEILSVAEAVDDYVQACYSREKALLSILAKGDFDADMLLDGWPETTQMNPTNTQTHNP
ncbi:DUF4376 domain-containing protein [Pseudomonas lurida]|jgi:hypothetical protein|uniref:DUF4376 domain-containing protein n=1 Tax=Pseudomonas lurida TaxID=244566 RepID=UPI001648E46B|nr:DUF4376 domain-containing protein [Pseudomonas lurida]MBC3233308.1 DUF4376 domain-containing protein [Pseudomonas lurida]